MQASNAKYREFKSLDLPEFEQEILAFWKAYSIFPKSISSRDPKKTFVFYEGPPSANGTPGIHHVISRSIKDIFCRYKTMLGFRVLRKSGWDTHGLPVELNVEKLLGITKEDIGKEISVAEYNAHCRREVMKYKGAWEELTERMGYWVDMQYPYITFRSEYIETLWHLLKQIYDKGLLYKGYTIQPYSPAAGTGLSSHELNQPGAYRSVKDISVTAMLRIPDAEKQKLPAEVRDAEDIFFLAWTTTPWTLPSNCALAVGKNILYEVIDTCNPYTFRKIRVILAADRRPAYFADGDRAEEIAVCTPGEKNIPWKSIAILRGEALKGIRYEQLMPYAKPEGGDAFLVVTADFVSTEDGTGIVHIAPSFGADDFRTAQQNGLGTLTLVDKQGKFLDSMQDLAGRYVKNYTDDPAWENPDILITKKLKEENRAFRVEKYEHNYPHCWRTDKPVIYYPLDSWFIRTTAVREQLIALNKTIQWKPKSTGEGRFAQWLENLVDWNLSRSRFWGTPLPVWRTEDGAEEKCIGSVKELQAEIRKAQAAGINADFVYPVMKEGIGADLHKPFVDEIILVSESGKPMRRESDLIDVWFDSGAMPYAQWHYPFENAEVFAANFPADFIAEGVDQTRGWFFTLHVIATIISGSVAYKNVVSNGLVLDKNGNKMSKRLGNSVDPFDTLYQYGADATRWYMISNSQPWDNLKFDFEGLVEVQRKFFGTLFNTYSFFALYANVDEFRFAGAEEPQYSELDRWIRSLLHSLVRSCTEYFETWEPTRAARAIEEFTGEHLSNWYVRLSRRRFWKSENSPDKEAAYRTLYLCLETISRLMAPLAPFFAEWLFLNLNTVTGRHTEESVHLTLFPAWDETLIDSALEERMRLAQEISSTVLSLRKKENIKVRQPLSKIMIPVMDPAIKAQLGKVEALILAEVNVKEMEYISGTEHIVTKKIKPDFRKLGPRLGAEMKKAAAIIGNFSQEQIVALEKSGSAEISLDGRMFVISLDEVEILSEDIPGWLVAGAGNLTVALDVHITDALREEGMAREMVSRLQKMRKDMGLEITDRIRVWMDPVDALKEVVMNYKRYICSEILADEFVEKHPLAEFEEILVNDIPVKVRVQKI